MDESQEYRSRRGPRKPAGINPLAAEDAMRKPVDVFPGLLLPVLLPVLVLVLLFSLPAAGQMVFPLPDHKRPPVIFKKKTPLDQPLEEILPVNINTADAATLMKVPGINRRAARQIVNYRDRHGRYASLDEIAGFSGISRMDIPQLRNYLVVE
ncbi:MAG: helix-hairpin-helix domain-containing protein [Desulfobulbaceae bacterium]|nr:helix-hairpin-helix domain-containing protein [Desulfobulbaceae bacterium]